MNIDFLLVLSGLMLASGLVTVLDWLFWQRARAAQSKPMPMIIDYSRSLFPVFLIVLLIRSFIAQPFSVPTGSLVPTVQPVELVLVNQFAYGLRLPVFGTKIMEVGHPKRGDIVVFHWPVDHQHDFVKRVIGLPGDRISYINKVLYVNGVESKQTFVDYKLTGDTPALQWKVMEMKETLDGKTHKIYVCTDDATECPNRLRKDFANLTVPAGHYFMMGDNRDDSDDSRGWGFVSDKDLLGKGMWIIFSWDPVQHRIRWDRIGTSLAQQSS